MPVCTATSESASQTGSLKLSAEAQVGATTRWSGRWETTETNDELKQNPAYGCSKINLRLEHETCSCLPQQ